MANLQHYPLPDSLRKQLHRADSFAVRLNMQRQPAPDCISISPHEYETAEAIVRHLGGDADNGLMWHGRRVICAVAA